MTRKELDTLIAVRLFGMTDCPHWTPTWYQGRGAALVKSKFCPHPEGKCYSRLELETFMGRMGGPPQYCASSRAGLVLLAELRNRSTAAILVGQVASWTLELRKANSDGLLAIMAGPIPAPTAELAIALTAADLCGTRLAAEDIFN